MTPNRMKPNSTLKSRRAARFIPTVMTLEDRTVPATFYVDPTLAGQADNASVTFNANYPNSQTGLVYAKSFAFWSANQATVNAFSDLGIALQVSEANAGADTIRIAHGQVPIPNPSPALGINSINVTQDLTLIGSGQGATILSPTNNTTFDGVDDDLTSVFRVSGGNFKSQDLRFEGGGKQIGAAFVIRSGVTATFDSVAVSGAIFTPTGASSGASIVGFNAVKLDVRNSDISNYGRNGVLFINTPGSVVGTNITGRGAGNLANNGIEADASKVFITGSMITANNGSVSPTDVSSAIIALNDATNPALVSDVTLIGNTITGNTVGLNLGVTPNDGSIIRANYNNIFMNEVGAFGKNAVDRIIAPLNWWGDASGPFNVSASPSFNNPTGLGNPAQSDVKVEFRPFLTNRTPKVATLVQTSFAAGVTSYLTQISTVGVAIVPVGPSSLTTATASVQFNVTFAKTVTGFDATDVVTAGTIGGSKAVAVTGSGTSYVVTVSGLTGNGTISISTPVQAALDNVDGFLTAASNTSTITVAVPPVVPPAPISASINPVGSALLTTATSSVQFAVTFSTAVTGFDAADVVLGGTIGGTKTTTITGSGASYTVTVGGLTGNGTITLQVPQASVVDPTLALGASTNTATITVAVPPVVPPAPISVAINPVGPAVVTTAATTAQFTVTFSAPVTGFDASDVVAGGTIAGIKSASVSGSGTTYTVTVTTLALNGAGNGTFTLQIPQASVVDLTLSLGAASNTATITVAVPPPVVPPLPTKLYAIGADAGAASDVQVYGANGVARFKFVAFESTFTGGVRVATADVNGDGTDDIIVAAGLGGAARIRIINGVNGEQIANFFAYDPSFRGGAFVAAGDLNGDGKAEIVTGAGAGGGPHIRVFDANGNGLQSFFAYSPTFTGGVTVAVGDTNGDGTAEIVTGPGAGGGPEVRTFNGQTVAPMSSFFAFDATFTGGVFVAVGNVGANGAPSIVAGPGSGGLGAIVRVFNASGTSTSSFTAYEAAFTGGVRVAIGDTNGDGRDDIITAAGPTGGARIRGFNNGVEVLNALAFDGTSRFGYFVG